MGTYKPEFQDDTIVEIKDKTTEPPMYRVLLHNDDFTTKTFVVEVLMGIFNKTFAEATTLMWHVHKNGTGLIDVYTYEVAETKIKQTTALAQEHGFPLKTTMEQE